MKLKPYPSWVCHSCGMKAIHRDLPKWTVGDYYLGKCGVCGEIKEVTAPRDFQYPKFEGCESWEQAGIF